MSASLAVLALAVSIMAAPWALAGTTPPAPAMLIDGVLNETDTQLLDDDQGNVKELGPLNSNTTKIGVIHSDAVPTLGLTNPNGQVDLQEAEMKMARDTDGDDWFYFSWLRDANSGSGFIAIEIMQSAVPAECDFESSTDAELIDDCNPWANRAGDPQPGDFLILWDQQGGSKDLFLRRWTGTAPNLTLSAGVQLNSSVSAAAYTPDGFGGEAAINLTDAVYGGVQSCRTFANVIPSTVTGNSDTADYKDTILEPVEPFGGCLSSTVTTPKLADGTTSVPTEGVSITPTGKVSVRDSAVVTVTGGPVKPTGSVAFWLCGPTATTATTLCSAGGTSVGTSSISAANTDNPVTVVSPLATVSSAGRYCWRAEYSGDAGKGIPISSDSSATECFLVTPVTPTLTTDAGTTPVTLGNAVTDTAELGGTAPQPGTPVITTGSIPETTAGAAAGGTITFYLYGPSTSGCGSLATNFPADGISRTVSGNGTYPTAQQSAVQFTPSAPGTYNWKAVYSGNSPNTNSVTHNADCTDADERVVVQQLTPALSTAQRFVPNDSATISVAAGGGAPTGSVLFELFVDNSSCVGTADQSATVPLPAGNDLSKTVSTSFTQEYTSDRSFYWRVTFTSTNASHTSTSQACGKERSSIDIDNDYVANP